MRLYSDRFALALRLLVGAAVAVLAYRFLRHQDTGALFSQLRHSNLLLIALATTGNGLLVWSKAFRARLMLAPSLLLSTRRLSRHFLASYAADNLLMSQAGVALRVGFFMRDGIPLATAAAEQVVEKVVEGLGLLLLAPLAALWPAEAGISPGIWAAGPRPLYLALGAVAATVALGFLMVVGRGRSGWLARIDLGAAALRKPGVAAAVGALTLFGWAVELAMVALTLRALALPTSLVASSLVVLAVNLAALVPGLPANLGTFEAATVLALAATGVERVPALGFALVYHALHTVPVTLLGLPGFLQRQRRQDRPQPPRDTKPPQ